MESPCGTCDGWNLSCCRCSSSWMGWRTTRQFFCYLESDLFSSPFNSPFSMLWLSISIQIRWYGNLSKATLFRGLIPCRWSRAFQHICFSELHRVANWVILRDSRKFSEIIVIIYLVFPYSPLVSVVLPEVSKLVRSRRSTDNLGVAKIMWNQLVLEIVGLEKWHKEHQGLFGCFGWL